ncbi:response regulator transcription factor|uniref:response regulator n=1 Tax=Noviherbaspirillum sp. L7-7A TaxID=2850560 RepID=UPI001C2C9ACB|nr:response regulator transcription factor [Noviherbaspirillum sp. L7-7A]MBV0881086.1 response regulator transcription factor [Noviherbaspirillum sp. L7-7A]
MQETIKIMLVDDHQTMLWGLEQLIRGEAPRMEVIGTARNSEDALSSAQRLAPDLILLDVDLGGSCSVDILPGLLANGVSKVLLLTGSSDQEILDLAIKRGARGILHKKAATADVLKAIEKVHCGELWLDNVSLGRVLGNFMNPVVAPKPDPDAHRRASLTSKERKVIQAVVEGNGALNKVIAERLFISEYTLRNHLTSIYQKLQVANRLELYVYAVKHGLGVEQVSDPSKKSA